MSHAAVISEAIGDLPVGSIVVTSTPKTRVNRNFIERVRVNTIQGKQVFAPMAFWQYQPKLIPNNTKLLSKLDIARSNGHFGDRWFNHLSFFVSDFKKAWDNSDRTSTDTYKLLLSMPGVTILRAPDADCVVEYSEPTCSRMSVYDQLTCTAQRLDNVGSGPILAMKLLKDGSVKGRTVEQ